MCMRIFKSDNLVKGEMYFCVKDGVVYYLEANVSEVTNLVNFFTFYNDESEQMFDAYECQLIYKIDECK